MPDKHEVGGSSPLGPTSIRKDARQTIIENRIKKRNETDSCRKDFLIERLEGLSEKWEKTILHLSRKTRVESSDKRATFYDDPNNYLRSSSKKQILREQSKRSCSSEKEHKVNALAPRAEEGRDNLR